MTDDMKKVVERESKWQRRWRDAKAFVPKMMIQNHVIIIWLNFLSCLVRDCMRDIC